MEKVATQPLLAKWKAAIVKYVRAGVPDLTNRQMAMLLVLHFDGPQTVRGLAKVLRVSKPVVTRGLNTLSALRFARRERSQTDKRDVIVFETPEGAEFLKGIGQFAGAPI
jgi:DNA-binding MarR family transcriptional regulator